MADLVDACILVYLDNIIIFSRNEKDHIKHVYMVLEWLNNAGKTKLYNIEKTKLYNFTKSVHFLGYIVSSKGVMICTKEISII